MQSTNSMLSPMRDEKKEKEKKFVKQRRKMKHSDHAELKGYKKPSFFKTLGLFYNTWLLQLDL